MRKDDVGKQVILMGWVRSARDHGGVIFVDLRDRYGVVQVVFYPDVAPEAHQKARYLRSEYVIAVKGEVALRPEGTENPDLETGDIEIVVKELKILNESQPLPFAIEDHIDATEPVRLKHRFLDLRRPSMQKNLMIRHKAAHSIRNFMHEEGFLELETPFLTKSTPEGARDYLVPSRVNPGSFYALPQSPQLFKQLFMISGFDKYFQIVRCFRDEDLRADRQPEFTQLDLEMAFATEEDIYDIIERCLARVWKEILDVDLPLPFPRLSYDEAINRYGSDKPDLRFGMELHDLTEAVRNAGFEVFSGAVKSGGVVKGVNAKECADMSRKELDELIGFAIDSGAKGLAWAKVGPEGWQSPIAKFFSDSEIDDINRLLKAESGDLLLFVADSREVANETLGLLRLEIAKRKELIDPADFRFVWVTAFPMFEWSGEEKRWKAMHHPFTSPVSEDLDKLESDPGAVRARAYDLVLNGVEIGGGSIRIHRRDLQERVFSVLGIGDEEAHAKFSFLLEALRFGAPPHGGIALGFDRMVMILCGESSIREVIPFPKTQKAVCLLTDAPSPVTDRQLAELHIKLDI